MVYWNEFDVLNEVEYGVKGVKYVIQNSVSSVD